MTRLPLLRLFKIKQRRRQTPDIITQPLTQESYLTPSTGDKNKGIHKHH